MDENPYRSPECSDQQQQVPGPQSLIYGIPDWVLALLGIIAAIGTLVALLWPAVQ